MKKILSIIFAVLLLVMTLTSCAASQNQSQANPVSKITLTYVKAPLNVPSIVEKEKGFFAQAFEEYNLPIEYSNLTTGPEQTQALASGDIQFLNAVGATSVILAASNGADIKIISMYSRSPEAFMLFTNNDDIKTAADLDGKKIAGPKGTILHELLVAYLATADLTQDDVDFISMDIPSSQAALESKEVDCALLAGPTAYNAKQSGSKVVTTGTGLVDATIVVATAQSFYDEHQDLVEAFLNAQKTTLEYIENNYDEIIQLTADETELSAEAVKEMYPMYDFDMEITARDIESMKMTEQFLYDNKMIEHRVDIEDLVY